MNTIRTSIRIGAAPQTVWAVMDDLPRYPEWNELTPDLTGQTTVGSVVRGTLIKPGAPPIPIAPTINAIVGAREFRWLSEVPGDQGFRAEHYFLLAPTDDGGTELLHGEDFEGPAIPARWPGIQASSPPAFDGMNRALKRRAEEDKVAPVSLHPVVDEGAPPTSTACHISALRCLCRQNPVVVHLTSPIYHSHLCGCSQCWKPDGALFALTAVVPSIGLRVDDDGGKLKVVDEAQAIRRRACQSCGAHMYGDAADEKHHFFGLCFVHPELSDSAPCGGPEFAGFVSSLIESGTSPWLMEAVRGRLAGLGVAAYDAFSPELMDIIAWHRRKIAASPEASRKPELPG